MNSYLNHYGCPFYNNILEKCDFSEDRLTPNDYYKAQCSDRSIEELVYEERHNYFIVETLAMLRRLPPSYITWQRITAIEIILNERN